MLMQNTFHGGLIGVLIFVSVMATGNGPAQLTRGNLRDVALAGSSSNPCGHVLFSDDFSYGNADGWTPKFDGTWSVDNYKYVVDIKGGANLRGVSLAGNTAWTDYVFEVDLKAEAGASKIILFRYIDENNYYSVGVIGLEPYNYYKVNLVKVENGVGTVIMNNKAKNTHSP